MKNLILFFALYLVGSAAVWSQTSPISSATAFTGAIPEIDGDVLNDAAWQVVKPITELVQQMPNYGLPASEATEVRIAFDEKNLYVSAVCYDTSPSKLAVTDVRRDADLTNTDAFIFIIDTYFDRQNGFVFGTNTVGIEYDAQVDNEGQGNFNNNRQQGGVIGGFNLNWDASWIVATEVGEYGWSAEFMIPLKTIRFKSGEDIKWGFNFQRNISKNNEIDFWSLLPLTFELKRLSLAGTLDGLSLKSPGNLKVIPYALTSITNDHTTDEGYNFDINAGADLKYSITPSMTLDLTYNTDFAQVEVDDQQVNLDRFNLFFPEKRPFFLENAGLFTVGSPGEVDLFFSRRIGIGDGGRQIPIIGGARLSGKLNNTNLGFLNMYTESIEDGAIAGNAYTVGRVNHEFIGSRSSIGGAIINRTGRGEIADDTNTTFAIDGKYGLGKKAQLTGFIAKTNTPGIEEGDHAFKLGGGYQWDGWNIMGAYTEVGEGFNPEVGFLFREDFRKVEGLIFKNIRSKEGSIFLENRPHISYRGFWDFEGFQETGFLHVDNHWVFKNLFEIHTGVNFTKEGVSEIFEISKGVLVPADTYDHVESQLVFITNPSKPIALSSRHVNGGFFGGTRSAHSGSLQIRLGDKFSSSWTVQHNNIKLPDGDFTANIFGSRISYAFTPSIFLQSLIQRNSVSKSWASNIRLGWLQQANTGLFVVFNQGRVDGGLDNTSLVIKFSKLFDVLN